MKVAEKYLKAARVEMPLRSEVYEVVGEKLVLVASFNSPLDAEDFAKQVTRDYESVFVIIVGDVASAYFNGVEVSNEPADSF